METGHELFVHGLNDILDAEQQLVGALKQLASDSSREDLKKAFESHRVETEGHVKRLQQCFELLKEAPERTECLGVRGLIAEKKAFSKENPSEDLIDVFNVGAGIKSETYEICEYESLIDMAKGMKHTQVAKLLTQNLKEEQAALKKLEGFSKKVKPEQMMSPEEEEKTKSDGRRTSKARHATA
jgi:ferritin-like metal-binding protein YciE